MPNCSDRNDADGAAPAETDQQELADDDRRQDQGEMDENVKELPPPEAPSLQQQRDGDAGNEARRHRDEGDFQAEANGRPLFRRKPIDHEPEVALPTNVKPCFSKKGFVLSERRKARNAAASGLLESLVSATG